MALLRSFRGYSSKVAAALGVTRGAVSAWKQIPAEYVVIVEQATGLPREQLRPDLYRAGQASAE